MLARKKASIADVQPSHKINIFCLPLVIFVVLTKLYFWKCTILDSQTLTVKNEIHWNLVLSIQLFLLYSSEPLRCSLIEIF